MGVVAYRGVVAMGPTIPRLHSHQCRPGPIYSHAPYCSLVGHVLPLRPDRVVQRVLRHGRGNGSLRPGRRIGPGWCHRCHR